MFDRIYVKTFALGTGVNRGKVRSFAVKWRKVFGGSFQVTPQEEKLSSRHLPVAGPRTLKAGQCLGRDGG